jgi:hypothetical protein
LRNNPEEQVSHSHDGKGLKSQTEIPDRQTEDRITNKYFVLPSTESLYHNLWQIQPFTDEAQTALFKDPVRTAL